MCVGMWLQIYLYTYHIHMLVLICTFVILIHPVLGIGDFRAKCRVCFFFCRTLYSHALLSFRQCTYIYISIYIYIYIYEPLSTSHLSDIVPTMKFPHIVLGIFFGSSYGTPRNKYAELFFAGCEKWGWCFPQSEHFQTFVWLGVAITH